MFQQELQASCYPSADHTLISETITVTKEGHRCCWSSMGSMPTPGTQWSFRSTKLHKLENEIVSQRKIKRPFPKVRAKNLKQVIFLNCHCWPLSTDTANLYLLLSLKAETESWPSIPWRRLFITRNPEAFSLQSLSEVRRLARDLLSFEMENLMCHELWPLA